MTVMTCRQLEDALKAMLTSLPLVAELHHPSMRDRHWFQLMKAIPQVFPLLSKQLIFDRFVMICIYGSKCHSSLQNPSGKCRNHFQQVLPISCQTAEKLLTPAGPWVDPRQASNTEHNVSASSLKSCNLLNSMHTFSLWNIKRGDRPRKQALPTCRLPGRSSPGVLISSLGTCSHWSCICTQMHAQKSWTVPIRN